jgi:catechol-2,3-dioxygenase
MTGRLSSVVFDCRDPHRLAHFYSELLGLPVIRVDGGSTSATARPA